MKGNFSQRSITALKWNYIGAVSRSGLQFMIGIILARLLGPQPFGLVAVVIAIMGLTSLVSEFGLGSALVQRKEISSKDIRFVFTLQLIIGFLFTVAVFVLAHPIAKFFHEPSAINIIKATAPQFLIGAAGQTSNALLRRSLDFKAPQLAQFVSYTIGYAFIGMPLAFNGFGVWSLVIAQMIQVTICSCILYFTVRHPIRPCLIIPRNGILDFGLKITVSNVGYWGFTNLDSIIIGRAFSVTDMGLYNRASQLLANPTGIIVVSMQSVLFSVSARKQNDIPALRKTYLAVIGAMGFVCFPLFFSIAVVPETIINAIYGSQWINASSLFMPLALVQPTYALLALGASVLTGVGKAGLEMNAQFVALGALVLLLLFASNFSMEFIAWAVFAAYSIRFALITTATLKSVEATWRSVLSSLLGPAAVGIVATVASYSVDVFSGQFLISPLLRLFIVAFASMMVAAIFFVSFRRWLVASQVAWLLAQLGSKLPKPLSYFLTGKRTSYSI